MNGQGMQGFNAAGNDEQYEQSANVAQPNDSTRFGGQDMSTRTRDYSGANAADNSAMDNSGGMNSSGQPQGQKRGIISSIRHSLFGKKEK